MQTAPAPKQTKESVSKDLVDIHNSHLVHQMHEVISFCCEQTQKKAIVDRFSTVSSLLSFDSSNSASGTSANT